MGSEVFLKDFRSSGLKIKEQDVVRRKENSRIQSGPLIADSKEGDESQEMESHGTEIAARRDNRRRMKVKPGESCKNDKDKIQKVITEWYAGKPNLCQSCGLSFKNPKRLEDHQMKATCSGRKCRFCGKMFPFKDWKDHMVDNHLEKMKIYECRHCKKQLLLSCNYTSHMRMHRREGNLAGKKLQKQKLELHRREGNLAGKKLQKQKLESVDDLENHRVRIQKIFKEFYDRKPNLCERCGFSFKYPNGLEVHQQNASCSEKKCKFCGMSFLHKDWQQHLLDSHLAEVRIYECKICQKQFLRYIDLKMHVEMHTAETTPYDCDICGCTLKNKKSLATHKLLHQGKEFKCDYCDYKTVRKSELTKHVHRHTERGKFDCKECGKHLANAHSLRQHFQRFHTNFKYQCSDCEKEFSIIYELQHHVERHHKGDNNLHICEKCKKGFHTKKLLNTHVRVVHSEDRIKCHFCGKEYRHHSRLKQHLIVHSKTKVTSVTS
ncbi:zinc finger protein 878-like isoform X2 [Ptychodera flava]